MQPNVLRWLDNSAKCYPDKIAVCDESGSITYSEYKSKSIAIARKIVDIKQNRNMSVKSPVVVFLNKSYETLVSFMGVAYSGGFYSPIDVEMPKARVDKILETLEPQVVITSADLIVQFQQYEYKGDFIMDSVWKISLLFPFTMG